MAISNINERISALRASMKSQGIDAYIIPSSDEHQSEYVADRFKTRQWISGFSGSAGTVVITQDHAGLWTDSRYFLQAEEQLANSEMLLHKIVTQGSPEYIEWIIKNGAKGDTVACDGMLFSKGQVDQYEKMLASAKIKIEFSLDLISDIWADRPLASDAKIYEHSIEFAGKSRPDKIKELQESFSNHADGYLVSALDDVAWLMNLRGADVTYNPVFTSYVYVSKNACHLFVDAEKMYNDLKEKLQKEGVILHPYGSIIGFLNQLSEEDTLHISAVDTSKSIYNAINAKIIEGDNYIRNVKGIKNETEIKHLRNAMEKDGVALTRTFMWIEKTLKVRTIKETEIRDQLAIFRSQQEGYVGESFGAIVGYKGNGAIIHYSPEEETCADISQDGMLLIDSGAQYMDGTTDTTRTIHLGTPTAEEKLAFTLVLKGYIALDVAKFPKGTTGIQLDILARMHLWEHGMNYGHGTGHGVGFLLNVHEGPQGISPIYNIRSKTPFQSGMITSNEPGFYKEGSFGIRMENLILTRTDKETAYGQFLSHETLTLFPIEIKLIDETKMSAKEKSWFNQYHFEVYNRLSPRLTEEENKWLKWKCRPLG